MNYLFAVHVDPSLYIAAIIAGIVSIVGVVITNRYSKRKDEAEAEAAEAQTADTFTDAALKLIAPLSARIDQLSTRVVHLEEENAAVHRWAKILVAQVIENGGTPITLDEAENLHGRRSTDASPKPV